MEIGLSLSLSRSGSAGWSPSALGSSLLGWWDAERSDLITQSSGSVSSWKDVVAGYDATQATGSLKPVFSATGFNGRPVLTFDGADDYLQLSSQPFPSGATAVEIWALVDQTAAAADATARMAVSYGGDVSTARRTLARISGGSTNLARVDAGDGTTTITQTNNSVTLNGRHAVRAIFTPTTIQPDVDGIAGSPTAAISATGTSRLRIGAISNTSPGNYWQGGIAAVLITVPLTTDQVSKLTAYLKTRGGIS